MTDFTNHKVLVVDDFETMRRIIRGLLKGLGCVNVDEAESGTQALEKLHEDPTFTFIITDINMPEMDGFDLLERLKQDQDLRGIPVLMVTAESRKDDILRAARLGASGYIVKPFTLSTLSEKVERILGRHKVTG